MEPAQANKAWWIVLNPTAMRELLGVLVKDDGEPVHVLMGPMEEPLVKALAEHAWGVDPTVDVSVAHGWAQAPDGLQQVYEAKRDAARAAVRRHLDEGLR
jgi:hypothetical protein